MCDLFTIKVVVICMIISKDQTKKMLNQEKLSRLHWSARRGMLELDLILAAYIKSFYFNSSEREKGEFHALLKCEDQQLFNWFFKSKKVDIPYQNIVNKILTAKDK